MIMFISLL